MENTAVRLRFLFDSFFISWKWLHEEYRKLEITKTVSLLEIWKQKHFRVIESMEFQFYQKLFVSFGLKIVKTISHKCLRSIHIVLLDNIMFV